ncbi:MAG TPA: high-potential iron-sulfur protein [Burkholderiales bacterium]|nr:high-potential iron-sulfur protein [Burkholderiales bacterium]
MRELPVNTRRRALVRAAVASALSLGCGARATSAQEHKPHLDEEDPAAAQLGYQHDAAQVDKKKFPTYKPGDACGNCQLFQGQPDRDEWAPCPIFPGKQVNVKGWCSSYMKRTT